MHNIAVFTCNRADESPMAPVIKAIEARDDLRHYVIDCKQIAAASCARACEPVIVKNGLPDIMLLLGDRLELLGAALAAVILRVPIAHIHGGETTRGAFDDKIRHAVSQLADIHFTAASPFTDKLVSMGIDPKTIHTVGAPSLDDLETDPVCEFGEDFFLVTLHPETTRSAVYNWEMADQLFAALMRFPDRRVVVTESNGDPGGKDIYNRFEMWRKTQNIGERALFVGTLGRRRYLTAMKHAAVVIGNSSSGIIEAPALGTPTVNIGRRQDGRPMATTIFTARADANEIAFGIECSLRSGGVRANGDIPPPYGHGGASFKIAETLASWSI